MSKQFHEQFDREEVPLPSERSTGLVFTAVALAVAYFWRGNGWVLSSAIVVGLGLAAVSLLAPQALRPLNVAWFRLAMLLNRIVSPVVMMVLFIIAIVPFGLIMQARYDPLVRRRRSGRTTYWVRRDASDPPSSMINQF